MLGLTDAQIANAFGVSRRTLGYWKRQYPEFLHTMQAGKVEADAKVAAALFHRATGYSHPEDKFFMHRGKVIVKRTEKHYPPDTVAAMVWLRNRQRLKWSDRGEIDFETLTDEQLNTIIDKLTERATMPPLRVAK